MSENERGIGLKVSDDTYKRIIELAAQLTIELGYKVSNGDLARFAVEKMFATYDAQEFVKWKNKQRNKGAK